MQRNWKGQLNNNSRAEVRDGSLSIADALSILSIALKDSGYSVAGQPPAAIEPDNRSGHIHFTKKELMDMPSKYRKSFYEGEIKVCYRKKKNGVYEARYHRGGIDIEVSSKDLPTLRHKFVAAFSAATSFKALESASAANDVTMHNESREYTIPVSGQNSPIFSDFAVSYLRLKEKTTKPSTFKEYKRLFEHDIIPEFGGRRVSDFDRTLLQDFLFEYVDEGKNRTAEKLRVLLKNCFDLIEADYKIESPMKKIVLPKYETKKGKAFTLAEEKELVEFCKQNSDRPAASALLVLLYTGMRRSELSSLEVIEDKWIRCETSKTRLGVRKFRDIPITPMMERVLPFIDFSAARETNLDALTSAMRRLFSGHHTHELRYTFITRCKERGINPEVVMLWAGHSLDQDVKTSAVDRGYTDYSKEYLLNEAKKFDYEL